MLPEFPPKGGAEEEAEGAGEGESSCLAPLPTSDFTALKSQLYPLRPTCSPTSKTLSHTLLPLSIMFMNFFLLLI